MRDRMSEIFWLPVTAASRSPRFWTTWPTNDRLWGRKWSFAVSSQYLILIIPSWFAIALDEIRTRRILSKKGDCKQSRQCHWTMNSHWGFYLLSSWAVQGPLPPHTGIDVPLLFEHTDLFQNPNCNCLVGTEVLPVDILALSKFHLKI